MKQLGVLKIKEKRWYKPLLHGIMELTKNHSRSKEAYTMNSIEEIFDNSNQLIDGIHHFPGIWILLNARQNVNRQ